MPQSPEDSRRCTAKAGPAGKARYPYAAKSATGNVRDYFSREGCSRPGSSDEFGGSRFGQACGNAAAPDWSKKIDKRKVEGGFHDVGRRRCSKPMTALAPRLRTAGRASASSWVCRRWSTIRNRSERRLRSTFAHAPVFVGQRALTPCASAILTQPRLPWHESLDSEEPYTNHLWRSKAFGEIAKRLQAVE